MRKQILFVLLGLSSCASPMGQFSVATNRNVNGLDSISTSPGKNNSRVRGESCRAYILFIPITSRPTIENALNEAIKKTPDANGLKDVTLTGDGLFTLFYNQKCYAVEGTPIKLGT